MTWMIGSSAVRVPIVFRVYVFTREVQISGNGLDKANVEFCDS